MSSERDNGNRFNGKCSTPYWIHDMHDMIGEKLHGMEGKDVSCNRVAGLDSGGEGFEGRTGCVGGSSVTATSEAALYASRDLSALSLRLSPRANSAR